MTTMSVTLILCLPSVTGLTVKPSCPWSLSCWTRDCRVSAVTPSSSYGRASSHKPASVTLRPTCWRSSETATWTGVGRPTIWSSTTRTRFRTEQLWESVQKKYQVYTASVQYCICKSVQHLTSTVSIAPCIQIQFQCKCVYATMPYWAMFVGECTEEVPGVHCLCTVLYTQKCTTYDKYVSIAPYIQVQFQCKYVYATMYVCVYRLSVQDYKWKTCMLWCACMCVCTALHTHKCTTYDKYKCLGSHYTGIKCTVMCMLWCMFVYSYVYSIHFVATS